MNKCQNCGTSNTLDCKFCVGCGQSLINNQTIIEESTQNINNTTFNSTIDNTIYNNVQNNVNNNQLNGNFSNKKKFNVKILLIIAATLIIVGVGVFIYFNFFGKNNKISNLDTIFDPNKPIIVKNNGKVGYITSEGKIMIEPKYVSAYDFDGDYAIVIAEKNEAESYNKTEYQIIDKKGNVKLTAFSSYDIKHYPAYNVWLVNDTLYDSKLNRITEENLRVYNIGQGYFKYIDDDKKETVIINSNGKKVYTVPGTNISIKISKNNYTDNDLYAYIEDIFSQPKKKIIISLKNGKTLYSANNVENGYIEISENGIFTYNEKNKDKIYLFFINNKLAYQTSEKVYDIEVYDYEKQILEFDYDNDYKNLGKEKRYYYYDVKNKKMLDEKPEKTPTKVTLTQTPELKNFSCSGKYGLVQDKKIIIPCEYDDIEFLNTNLHNYMNSKGKNLILLEKDEKTILYNLNNSKEVAIFDSTYVYDYDSTTFIKIRLDSDKYQIYNLISGKSIEVNKDDDVKYGSNYISVEKNGKTTYYNTNLKEIYVASK